MPESLERLFLFKNLLTGSIDLTQLPKTMRTLSLNRNQFTGSIDLTNLPEKLESLDLDNNGLSGSICLTRLSAQMKSLSLMNNQLTGCIDLDNLPEDMKDLYLRNNQLSGSIGLSKLAESMWNLSVPGNKLSGSVNLSELPPNLFKINLHGNCFTGSFMAKNFLKGTINAGGNRFCPIAVVSSKSRAMIDLRESGVTSVVDQNGRAKVDGVRLYRKVVQNRIRDTWALEKHSGFHNTIFKILIRQIRMQSNGCVLSRNTKLATGFCFVTCIHAIVKEGFSLYRKCRMYFEDFLGFNTVTSYEFVFEYQLQRFETHANSKCIQASFS